MLSQPRMIDLEYQPNMSHFHCCISFNSCIVGDAEYTCTRNLFIYLFCFPDWHNYCFTGKIYQNKNDYQFTRYDSLIYSFFSLTGLRTATKNTTHLKCAEQTIYQLSPIDSTEWAGALTHRSVLTPLLNSAPRPSEKRLNSVQNQY